MQTISITNDPNEMWDEWKHIFLTVADRHAPPFTKKVRSEYAPWITSEIKNNRRDFLKRKAVKTGSKQFHDAFTTARNEQNAVTIDQFQSCQALLKYLKNLSPNSWKPILKRMGYSYNNKVVLESTEYYLDL